MHLSIKRLCVVSGLCFAIWALSPVLAAPNVYFGNLHSHTSYSDGSGTPAQTYKYARDTADIDFLALNAFNPIAVNLVLCEAYLCAKAFF